MNTRFVVGGLHSTKYHDKRSPPAAHESPLCNEAQMSSYLFPLCAPAPLARLISSLPPNAPTHTGLPSPPRSAFLSTLLCYSHHTPLAVKCVSVFALAKHPHATVLLSLAPLCNSRLLVKRYIITIRKDK